MSGARRDLVVTCVPGLEDVTALELAERAGAQDLLVRRGSVRFASAAPLADLLSLRSVEYASLWLGEWEVPAGPAASAVVQEAVRLLDLRPCFEGIRTLRPLPERPSFRITGEREGEQGWSSMELQRWAGQAVVERWGLPVDLEGYDLEILVRAEGSVCWAAANLHRGSLRRRPWGVRLHPAALNPVIAYGMVRLAAPLPGERALDPFCGSGTILIEGARHEPLARWAGSDLDEAVFPMARENARAAGARLPLFRAHAGRLPVRDASLDLVLANLPFGRRSGKPLRNQSLYRAFLFELARVLRPGGRAALLALQRRLVTGLLAEQPLSVSQERTVNHGGLKTRLFLLRREREVPAARGEPAAER